MVEAYHSSIIPLHLLEKLVEWKICNISLVTGLALDASSLAGEIS